MKVKDRLGKPIAIMVCIILAFTFPGAGSIAHAQDGGEAGGAAWLDSDLQFSMILNKDTYADYLAQHGEAARPEREIALGAADVAELEGEGFEILQDGLDGFDGPVVLTGERGAVTFRVRVPETGLYNMKVLYYPTEGKSSSIERSIWIDGELPFKEAAFVQFHRVWDNRLEEIRRDNQGNDLRPPQAERPEWREKAVSDTEGYYEDPFLFYLTAGEHTITLISQREPMAIGRLTLYREPDPLPHAEALEKYRAVGARETEGIVIEIQGEDATAKSSPTLYPTADKSTPAVHPYSPRYIRINTIGGYNWRVPGDWIEWEFEVPESGLYEITFKAKQNWARGIYSTRKLTIDGKLPFAEAKHIPFKFANTYRYVKVGGDEEPHLVYLEKGRHTLRLEATLGVFADLVREVEESLLTLNEMYRKIVMITGTAPDAARDYRVEQQVPNLLETFEFERQRLLRIADEVVALSGTSGEQEAMLRTMAIQLEEMIERPETIPRRLVNYKINTGGMGTWLLRAREIPLQIDAIYITSPGVELPKKNMNFFAELWHQLVSFFYSFVIDYNQIGDMSTGKETRHVEVWIGSGRDQANTIKAMIDETFTPETGIRVTLKLVQMHNLLPATLAGQGPDVAMQVGNDIPVNYGMRNAAYDLTQFPDFWDVAKRFRESALVPYRFEGGVYALPETQTFPMLFYRKDILLEIGVDVPQTWDDVKRLLAVLNKHRMAFALPLVAPPPAYPGETVPINATYAMILLQNGGQFYRNDNKESDLDSRIGIESFKTWTEYYTDYKLEREFDFANRFRTGEMPIGIMDYTVYNQLTVFAPEIRGMWGFVPVPGTVQEDGTIRRDAPSSGTAVIMLQKAKDKEAAWEFMKWWTREDTQVTFGREMEALMGAAARYPTANIAALDKLPWPVEDYENLKRQFEEVRGIPEVPGGYFTGRHLQNAFYKVVVSQKAEPREAIMDYVQYIHDEIRAKRKEFGLPL